MTAAQAIAGVRILADWVGEGLEPVSKELAQARADVCQKCEFNYRGEWRWPYAIAEHIRRQMEQKAGLSLHVQGEENIHVCEKCGCQLPLKIWTPFETIYRRTSDAMFAHYPTWCFMVTENQHKPKV